MPPPLLVNQSILAAEGGVLVAGDREDVSGSAVAADAAGDGLNEELRTLFVSGMSCSLKFM